MTFVARIEGGFGENGEVKWVGDDEQSVRCGRELWILGEREGKCTTFLDVIS